MEEGSTPVERGVLRGYGQARDARNIEMGQRRQQAMALKELSARMYENAMRYSQGSYNERGEYIPPDTDVMKKMVDRSAVINREADRVVPTYVDAQGNTNVAGNAENPEDYYDPAFAQQRYNVNASYSLANKRAANTPLGQDYEAKYQAWVAKNPRGQIYDPYTRQYIDEPMQSYMAKWHAYAVTDEIPNLIQKYGQEEINKLLFEK